MVSIPTEESMSADWFNEVFASLDMLAEVVEFDSERIGTGQIGKCVRYHLRYKDSANDGPKTLVGKFPSDDENSRATGVALRNFLKEVRFYQQLQDKLSVRTPKCYFADIVEEGPEFFLLMEDLSPAQQGDQLKGCSEKEAESALRELTGLHAPLWSDQSLLEKEWLIDLENVPRNTTRDLYRLQLPGFLDRYGPFLAPDEREIISRVGEAERSPLSQEFPSQFSLVHVDYRLDNLMFRTTVADQIEVTVVDWQSITVGSPLNDVAYFLGAGLEPSRRVKFEKELVGGYFHSLQESGVDEFSWNDCWELYRQGVFAGFAVTVVASMLVQQTERGDKMFTAMAKRHSRHALDLGSEEFLIG